MDVIIKTGFQSVSHHIAFQPQTVIKGRNLVLAEHVRDVEEHRKNNESYLIKSRVIRQASVHATPYITSLKINATRCITDVECNCVYNQSKKCKHIAALIYYINDEESASKTSKEQVWGKPSARQFAKKKYAKGSNFETMEPHKYTQLHNPQVVKVSELVSGSPLKRILTAESTKNNIHTVRNVLNSLLTQVEINLEKDDCAECVNNFLIYAEEHTVYKNHYQLDLNIEAFIKTNVQLSEKDIIDLCCKTLKQSLCNDWYKAKRLRISASTNVHNIKVLSRKPIENLVSEILYPNKIDSASTRYGLREEVNAKKKYEELQNCMVKSVGVIVSKSQPWLCASLDGVVIKDGCINKIVEFKCPSSCEKKPVVNVADKSCNVKYLEFLGDNLILKKTNCYYTQVQVQMYVTGMTVCDLFIYSPVQHGSCLVEVHRDEECLQTVIVKSEDFYFRHYLPALYATLIAEDIDHSKQTKENNLDDTDMVKNDDEDEAILQNRCFTGNDINNISKK